MARVHIKLFFQLSANINKRNNRKAIMRKI